MNRKLKVGIIGLGVGMHHFNCFLNNKNCEIVSVCDFKVSKLKQIKSKIPNLKITTNSDNIINNREIDLVCISTYDNFHAKQVIKSIKQNKHIFVEKPICTNFLEYKKIKKELKKRPKVRLASNFILRTSPQFIKLSKMIKNKKFGKIYFIAGEYNYGRLSKITKGWRGGIKNYSVTHGGGIHIIDLALSFIKEKPTKVTAMGNNISTKETKFKNNDITTSNIKFKNNLILNVTSNFGCVMPHHHTFKIYGTKLSFIQDFKNAEIFSSRLENKKTEHMSKKYLNKNKRIVLENFIDSIVYKDKKSAIITSKDVMNSMAISLAIEKSIKSKKWENIIY